MAVHVGVRGPGHLARVGGGLDPASLLVGNNGFYFDLTTGATGAGIASITSAAPSAIQATQATGSKQPNWTEAAPADYALYDGLDDELRSNLPPGAAMTSAASFRTPASSAGTQIVLGSAEAAGANRGGNIGYLTTGAVCGGRGSDAAATVTGGPTGLWSEDIVVLTRCNGLATQLYLGRASSGISKVYDQAPNGSPNTTIGYKVGANNINGTGGNFAAVRLYRAFAVQSYVDDVEGLMRALGRYIVPL